MDGQLPRDRERLLGVVRTFLEMDPEQQFLYRVGRRTGVLSGLKDLADAHRLARVESIVNDYRIRPEDVDAVTDDLMRRFI